MSIKLTISGPQLFTRMNNNFIAFKPGSPSFEYYAVYRTSHKTLLNYRIKRVYSVNNKFTGELSKKKNGV